MKFQTVLDATAIASGFVIGYVLAGKLEQDAQPRRGFFPYRNEDDIRMAHARGEQMDAAEMARRYGNVLQ